MSASNRTTFTQAETSEDQDPLDLVRSCQARIKDVSLRVYVSSLNNCAMCQKSLRRNNPSFFCSLHCRDVYQSQSLASHVHELTRSPKRHNLDIALQDFSRILRLTSNNFCERLLRMSRLEQCEQQSDFQPGEALTLARKSFHRNEFRQISVNVSQQQQQMRTDSRHLQENGLLGELTIDDNQGPDLLSAIKPLTDFVVAFDRFVRGQNEALKSAGTNLVFGGSSPTAFDDHCKDKRP